MDWGGGIAFLQLCLQGLETSVKKNNITVVLLIPLKKNYFLYSYLKNAIKILLNFINSGKFNGAYIKKESDVLDQLVYCVNYKVKLIRYKNTLTNLEKVSIDEDIDVLLPSFDNLGSNFSIPWIGYLYDFQHKEMPQFFSDKEIKSRDIDFSNMLLNAQSIIVNSKKVKTDINKYFEYDVQKIFTLPFTPFINKRNSESPLSVKTKYKIPEKYFIISNQFWVHKDHMTAFLAFASFCLNNSDYKLVCTGELSDYRNPSYINVLKNVIIKHSIEERVIFTGFLSKTDLLLLIENASCLIQPTLYEGGPGGGAVYDAYMYGIPIILSDIEINNEVVDCGNIIRFDAGNSADLCSKMNLAILKEKVEYSIINSFINNVNEELGNILINAIERSLRK